ncbi:MAG: acyltransferase [Myxococcota bacterium]
MSRAAEPAREAPGSVRSHAVDVLRGVAVLAVMGSHLPFSVGTETGGGVFPGGWFTSIAGYGQYGVHLFLVISGFCIHLRWARLADPTVSIDFAGFWKRRLARLYPPYLLVVLASFAAVLSLASVIGTPGNDSVGARFGYDSTALLFTDALLFTVMAQNLNGASHRVGNGPLWSLALEEQLYLLYFPLLRIRRCYGWRVVLGSTFAVTVGWRLLGLVLPWVEQGFGWFLLGPAFWFPWALGAYAVEVYLGHERPPKWLMSPLFFVGLLAVGVLCDPPHGASWELREVKLVLGHLVFAAAGFWLVLTWTSRERTRGFRHSWLGDTLLRVGIMSYSLYLTHQPVFVISKRLALAVGLPPAGALAIRVIAAFAVAIVFYRWVELPAVRYARHVRVPMRKAPTPHRG